MLAKISPTQSKTTLAIQSFAETAMSPQDVETVRRASVLLNIPLSLKQRIFVNVKGDAKTTTMIFESRFKLQPTTEKTLREMGLEKIYKGNSKEYTWQATFTQKLYEALEELATKINKQGEESVETPYFDEVGTATFAPAQTQEVAYDVQNIPLESIFIDKARFQPRDDFSEEKVNEIVNNFNPALFKPLIVWKDPKDGKIYVLAGHHRYEALKRLKRKSAPVVFAQGDEQKAVELAWTENQSGRSQTAAENAKYLRKLAMSGRTKGEIQTECKRLYDRSCQVALDLAYLNPRGKALVDLGLMPRESETFRDMETMAQWIGKLRGRFEELTNSHENEVYDFLRENYKIRGKKFTNFAEFSAFMENIITKRTTFGKVDEVLNINTYTPQNTVQAEYDAEIARAERELAEAMEMLKKEREKALLREMKGEITVTQREIGLRKYEDAVTIAQRELLRLNEAKGKGVREAKESEMALFGLEGIKQHWKHFRFVVPATTFAMLGIEEQPIWADCEALFRKRTERDEIREFHSEEELCKAIQFVLENPDGRFTATKHGAKGIYRIQDGVYPVVLEVEKKIKVKEARIVTVYFAPYEKFKEKIKKLNRVVANSPNSGGTSISENGFLSGRLGVPFNTHSTTVSTSKDTNSPAENQELSDTGNIRETLLQKWNTSTLTDDERETIRRGATLLGITLPSVNVSAESSPKTEWWLSATNNVETPLGMGKIVYWKVRIGGMVTGGGTALRWGLLVNDLIFPHAELQPIKSNLIPFEILSDESLRGWIAFSHQKKKPSGQRDTAMFVTKLYRESAQRIQEYIEYQKIEAERANTPPILAQNLQRGDILAEWHEPTKEFVFVERILSDAYDPPQFVTYVRSTEKSRFNRYDTQQIHAEVLYGFRYVQNPISTPEQIQAALLYVDKEELDEWENQDLSDSSIAREAVTVKWGENWSDISFPDTEREKLRRAASLLRITLPDANVRANPLPEKPQESQKPTSGYPPRPEAVTESAELIPQPEIFFPKGKYEISDDAYMACNLALTRYKKGGRGFLLADGTGFGKTRQILVIAHEYQQMTGQNVLIVTENESIIQGNFKKDQEALRIVNPKVEITTYTKVADGLFTDRAFALVAFDEAHNLKNSDSLKTIASNKLTTNHTLFATATPMDTVVGAAYFISAVTNIPKNQVFAMLGFRVETKTIDGQPVQKIVLDKNTNYEVIKKNIVKVRQDMIESGAMVRRVFPFYGEVRSIMIPLTDEQRDDDDEVWSSFEDQIDGAKEERAFTKAMNLAGQRSGELSRLNEPRKIQTAYDLVKGELAKGNQVVVIAEGINTTTISAINKTVRGTIETLVERLKAEGIGVSEGYGANKSAKVAAIADFQSGKNKVIIGTPQSISTGIDLDDQTGNAPRALIMVTASYSGNTFQQILGRVSRRNTLSPAEVIILYTESVSDRRRKEIVDKKLEVLRLIQSGKAVMDAEETEGLEQSVSKIQGGTKEESSENITRGVAVTESGDKAAVSIKQHGNGLLVYGNTFPLRETLKNLGGRWNGTLKGWIFPPSKMDELNAALKITSQQPESAVLEPVQYASQADIFLKRYGNQSLHLKGNTMRVDKEIRELGGVWNQKAKAWQFPSWQKNALEAKLGIKLWEDSSQQMALRDAEEEFLQEWFGEEGVSLQENSFDTFENDTMPNPILRERLHIDTTVPEYYSKTFSLPLPETEIQLLSLYAEMLKKFQAKNIPIVHLMDSSNSSLAKFQGDWWDGQHHFEQGVYSLHIRLNKDDAKNRAIVWHEYAHHLLDTLPIRESEYWNVFLDTVQKTSAWQEACWYDEVEEDVSKEKYWTLEKEVWARAASQYFLMMCKDHHAVRELQERFLGQWKTRDFFVVAEDVYALLHSVNLLD